MVGIETGVDKLLDLVQEKKEITVMEAAKKLKVPEDRVESWGRILSDEDILELVYPANPLNPPFLKVFSKEAPKKKKEKKKAEKKPKRKPKKKVRKKAVRGAKARSSRFFSRFRFAKTRKRRTLLPYVVVLVLAIVLVLYFTGVIGWLASLLSP
jgi:hypothetical protein